MPRSQWQGERRSFALGAAYRRRCRRDHSADRSAPGGCRCRAADLHFAARDVLRLELSCSWRSISASRPSAAYYAQRWAESTGSCCRPWSSPPRSLAAHRVPAGGMAAAPAARVHLHAFLSQQVRLPHRVAALRADAVERRGAGRAPQRHPRGGADLRQPERPAMFAIRTRGAVLSAGGLAGKSDGVSRRRRAVARGRRPAAVPRAIGSGSSTCRNTRRIRSCYGNSSCRRGWTARVPGA